jgi:hypothetical protein
LRLVIHPGGDYANPQQNAAGNQQDVPFVIESEAGLALLGEGFDFCEDIRLGGPRKGLGATHDP